MINPREALLATVGISPQVVTITLDLLANRGHKIVLVVSVHTSAPVVVKSMELLSEELAKMGIAHRPALIAGRRGPVDDFRTKEDAAALLATLCYEMRSLKESGYRVHLSISGGRRMMSAYALVVAQLFFDTGDRAWHLFSEPWERDGDTRMHLRPDEHAVLIPVPVLPWGDPDEVKLLLSAGDDLWEAFNRLGELPSKARSKRREFLASLSPAERELVDLMVGDGMGYAEMSRHLHKSRQTVANQASSIYRKLSAFLGSEAGGRRVDRAFLIYWLGPYFERGKGK